MTSHGHVYLETIRPSRMNRPYSRRGHDGQKERLGWQIYRKFARQYVNSIVTSRSRDVTSLFRHLPYEFYSRKRGIGRIRLGDFRGALLGHAHMRRSKLCSTKICESNRKCNVLIKDDGSDGVWEAQTIDFNLDEDDDGDYGTIC